MRSLGENARTNADCYNRKSSSHAQIADRIIFMGRRPGIVEQGQRPGGSSLTAPKIAHPSFPYAPRDLKVRFNGR